MLFGVANEALKHNVDIRDRKIFYQLFMKMEDVMEQSNRDLITGELEAYVAKGTCIATGGYGRVFKQTTNAVI